MTAPPSNPRPLSPARACGRALCPGVPFADVWVATRKASGGYWEALCRRHTREFLGELLGLLLFVEASVPEHSEPGRRLQHNPGPLKIVPADQRWASGLGVRRTRAEQKRHWVATGGDPDVWEAEHPLPVEHSESQDGEQDGGDKDRADQDG